MDIDIERDIIVLNWPLSYTRMMGCERRRLRLILDHKLRLIDQHGSLGLVCRWLCLDCEQSETRKLEPNQLALGSRVSIGALRTTGERCAR